MDKTKIITPLQHYIYYGFYEKHNKDSSYELIKEFDDIDFSKKNENEYTDFIRGALCSDGADISKVLFLINLIKNMKFIKSDDTIDYFKLITNTEFYFIGKKSMKITFEQTSQDNTPRFKQSAFGYVSTGVFGSPRQ